MGIYPDVTEQQLINLIRLTEQQKNHWAIKIKYEISKQTHDKNLAEIFSPIKYRTSRQVYQKKQKK